MNRRLLLLLIFLLFLAAESFLWIPGTPDWRITFVALSIILYIIARHPYNLKRTGFKYFIYSYVVLWIVSFAFTFYNNIAPSQTEIRSFMMALPMVLLFRPFVSIGSKYGYNALLKPMEYFSRMVVVVLLLQYFGLISLMSQDSLSEREGMRTFVGTIAMVLGVLLLLHRILFIKRKRNILSWIWLLLTFTSLVLVNQSRSAAFAVVGAMGVLIYYRFSGLIKRAGIIAKLLKIVIVFLVLYFAYNYVLDIVSESISNDEASSVNRLQAYAYYWNKFLQYPLTGVGLSTDNKLIADGVYMRLYVDDIGIVGYLAQTGLFGLFMQAMILKGYVYNVKRIHDDWKYFFIAVGVFYILISPFNSYMYTHLEYVAYALALISVIRINQNNQVFQSHGNSDAA